MLCVSDADSLLKIETVAQELGIELITQVSPEAILRNTNLVHADSVIVECSELGSEASLFIEACRKQAPDVPVIPLLKDFSSSAAVRLSRTGFFDCLDTLSVTDQFFHVIQSAFSQVDLRCAQSRVAGSELWRRQLVGQSSSMEQVVKIIRLVAARRCTVLISGETGTGKEMAARAIHMASDRARRPMVAVNCSAIPENLIEAELFGHVKGAFTGAVNHRMGRFEQANGGTLFLDEIGELPFDLQAKLLRVLQEREFQRLGSNETVKIDVRVIAATNADLLSLVRQGRFREDLYYRLNVVPMHIPALRERVSDIALLASHFVHKVCEAEHLGAKQVSRAGLERLMSYNWPGNVRQLENVIEQAVVMSGDRECLYPSDFCLPDFSRPGTANTISIPASNRVPDEGLNYTEALKNFERAILQQAMSRAQGNKTLAADILQLPRTTLIHKLRVLEHLAVA